MVADAGQKEIAKCYKFLVNVIKEKVEMVTPASLVRRFCAVLGLGVREMKAAEEMARTAVPSEGSTRSAPCLTRLMLFVICVGCNLEVVEVERSRMDSVQHPVPDAAAQGAHLARPAGSHRCLSLQAGGQPAAAVGWQVASLSSWGGHLCHKQLA